jgi:paraquat-inducible protein B
MGRRANPTLIGAFIVGAAALIVIGLLVFGRGQFFTEKRIFVLYFDGSVKGLSVGAPVDFQGVRIGSVIDIKVQYLSRTNEFRTPVYIQVETDRVGEDEERRRRDDLKQFFQSLIQRGLRAQLASQSLVTGQLIVQLGFHPDTPVRLVGGDPDVAEMPTIPTPLQQAQAAAQSVLEKIQQLPLEELFASFMQIIDGTNRLVNSPELTVLMKSMSAAMVETQQVLGRVDAGLAPLFDEAQHMTAAAHTLLTDLQQLLRRVDGQIGPLADDAKQTFDTARGTLKDSQLLIRNIDGRMGHLSESFADTAKAAQTTMAAARRNLDGDIILALQELTATARAIRLLVDYLERNPNALLYGKGGDRR